MVNDRLILILLKVNAQGISNFEWQELIKKPGVRIYYPPSIAWHDRGLVIAFTGSLGSAISLSNPIYVMKYIRIGNPRLSDP